MVDQLLGVVTHFESEMNWYDIENSGQPRLETMKHWIDQSAAIGSQVVRIPASWAQLEPYEGYYHQGYINEQIELIRYAGDSGIQVIYEFAFTPTWARQLPNEVFSPPINNQDYADALAHIYSAFCEAGVDNAISGLEVWNEPNVAAFWPGANYRNDLSGHPQSQGVDSSVDYAAAVAYTQMLNAAYAAVKAVDENATVLGGSLAGTDTTYLQWMLDNGAQMDGLAVHPYTRNFDGIVSKPARPGEDPTDYDVAPGLPEDLNERFSFEYGLNELNTVLENAGMGDVNLWLTEMGFRIADYNDGNTNDDHLIVDSAEEQASYIQEALDIISGMDFVAAATVFQLYDTHDGDFGLIDDNGNWRPSAMVLSEHIDYMATREDSHEIFGTNGDDLLEGTDADECFFGEQGDDTLAGGNGSDLYFFAPGDGSDVITEAGDGTSTDALVFDGIQHDELLLVRVGDDLVITQPFGSGEDAITILNQFSGVDGDGIEEVRFQSSLTDEGEAIIWTRAQIEAYTDMSEPVTPVDPEPETGDKNVQTGNTNTVYGSFGNDELWGTEANDLIISDSGDDVMVGSAGNDILVGVSGNDQVDYRGEGSSRDEFTFMRNDDGSVSVSSSSFGNDLLWDVDSVWFEGSDEWVEMDELAA